MGDSKGTRLARHLLHKKENIQYRRDIMKYGLITILIILILFFLSCQNPAQESTEKAGAGGYVDRSRLTTEFASTYLGGSGHEFCEAIAVDDAGNIYVAGNTRSADFPTTDGTYNREPKGKSDVFIAKFDNDLGTLLASTIVGGEGDECAYTMLFDPRGYVYVAGYTDSENFPTTEQAYDRDYNGGDGDAFILKMDGDLAALVSSTYLGGSGVESDWRSPELVQDGDGNIYIAGITDSDDFPTTSGAYQEIYNGGTRDVFLAKFDPDLKEMLASTLLGGSGDDRMGRSLCIDAKNDEICVGGYTFSPDFPTSQDAYGKEVSGQLDGFVTKLSMDLKAMTASTILKSGWIYSMMIHDNGDIYVGGHAGNRLPTTPDAFYRYFDKAFDQGFISCLSGDLSNLKASTVLPGSYATGGGRICSLNLCPSPDGHVLSAGWVRPIDFPITAGVFDETQNGLGDTYILKMNRGLSEVLLSTFIGGSRSERWNRMTTDGTGNIYLASHTLSDDFPTTGGAAFVKFGSVIDDEEEDLGTSARDAFIIKIDGYLSAEVFEEFHEAAKRDQVKILQELLTRDESWLEKSDKYQRTPLHSAARFGASSAVKFLLEKGADVSVMDESGNTALHLASIFGHGDIVNLLIGQEAEVDALNTEGQAPLHLASRYGNPECIKLLLSGEADSNIRDMDGNTPLHIAALFENHENLDEILKAEPDIDAVNDNGYTPLLLAVQQLENEKVVEQLLLHGADANITEGSGKNALLLAVYSNRKEYISILLSKGIDINSRDEDGNTALHYPMYNVLRNKMFLPLSKDISGLLIGEGADPHIKNKEGKSPLDLATKSGENELIELLK
jgi:ankyrin repeat protein